jgi:hypothetical protein
MAAPITSSSFAKTLWPGVNAWYGKAYDEYPVEYTQLFDTESSNRAYEEDVGVTSFGLAGVKPEGQAIAFDEERQAFITRYTHVVYGLGFVITREIYEDDLYDVVGQRRAKGLAFSMRQTKEVVGANVYNRAFDAGFVGGDGKEMIATDHPNFAGGSQSNELAVPADFSEAALEQACIDISKWTNDRGLRINVMPECLIIPTDVQFEAERVLGTEYRTAAYMSAAFSGSTDSNDISAVNSMGKLPKGYKVNHYLTDTNAWFLRTNAPEGLKHFVRRGAEFTIDNDFDTENAKYKATERYSFGWTDWRGIYGSAGS